VGQRKPPPKVTLKRARVYPKTEASGARIRRVFRSAAGGRCLRRSCSRTGLRCRAPCWPGRSRGSP